MKNSYKPKIPASMINYLNDQVGGPGDVSGAYARLAEGGNRVIELEGCSFDHYAKIIYPNTVVRTLVLQMANNIIGVPETKIMICKK